MSGSTLRRPLLFSKVHVHSYVTLEDTVVLPNVDIARGAAIRHAVIDKLCRLPAKLRVGLDLDEDRRRFFVTPRGVTVVTPEMLCQSMHHLN